VERVGPVVVAEHVPDRRPPAAGPQQLGNLVQRLQLVEPVERGGGEAEVEAGAGQRRVLEGRLDHAQRRRYDAGAQELGETGVGFDGE